MLLSDIHFNFLSTHPIHPSIPFHPSIHPSITLQQLMDFCEIWYWVLLTNFPTIHHQISVLVSVRSNWHCPGLCSVPKCHYGPAIDSCCMMPEHHASNLLLVVHAVQKECFSWTGWPLKMGLVGWLEMSVNESQHLLCNSPEEGGIVANLFGRQLTALHYRFTHFIFSVCFLIVLLFLRYLTGNSDWAIIVTLCTLAQ